MTTLDLKSFRQLNRLHQKNIYLLKLLLKK